MKTTFIVAVEGSPQACERAKATVQTALARLTNPELARNMQKSGDVMGLPVERSGVFNSVYAVTEVFQGVACSVHLFTQCSPATDKQRGLKNKCCDTDAEIFEVAVEG